MTALPAAAIRALGPGDRDALTTLARQQLAGAGEAEAYVAHLLAEVEQGRVTVLLAFEGDALAGCVSVSAPAAETAANGTTLCYAMIADLYVDPERRGRGVARALTAAAEAAAHAAGAERAALKVLAGNDAALAFYEAAGYTARFHVLDRALTSSTTGGNA